MKNIKGVFACANIVAQVVFSGGLLAAISPEDSSGAYSVENWYGYRSNANIVYTAQDDSIRFSQVDSTAYVWGYFDSVKLGIGEKLAWSGTLTLGRIASKGVLTLGIFNSGLCSERAMITHTYQSGTDVSLMKNYTDGKNVIGTVLGGMTGVSVSGERAYLRSETSKTSPLSTSNGAQQESVMFPSAFSAPKEGVAYDFTLEISKTDSGLNVVVILGDEGFQAVSFTTDIDTFDVLGIRSPVTASGAGITLSNFSIGTTGAVIPEPSYAIVLVGVVVLMGRGVKRRRNHAVCLNPPT